MNVLIKVFWVILYEHLKSLSNHIILMKILSVKNVLPKDVDKGIIFLSFIESILFYDDVTTWKHFPNYWEKSRVPNIRV